MFLSTIHFSLNIASQATSLQPVDRQSAKYVGNFYNCLNPSVKRLALALEAFDCLTLRSSLSLRSILVETLSVTLFGGPSSSLATVLAPTSVILAL